MIKKRHFNPKKKTYKDIIDLSKKIRNDKLKKFKFKQH